MIWWGWLVPAAVWGVVIGLIWARASLRRAMALRARAVDHFESAGARLDEAVIVFRRLRGLEGDRAAVLRLHDGGRVE